MPFFCEVKDDGVSKRCSNKPTKTLPLVSGRTLRVCARHYQLVTTTKFIQLMGGNK